VIRAVAFCPHPPLLVPEVAQGAAAELDGLRTACRTAIRRIAMPGTRLVVVGSGAGARAYRPTARGSLAGYGVAVEVPLGSDEPGPVELPFSLTIGAWLLRDVLGPECGAVGYSLGAGDPLVLDDSTPVALLVMGDGSARRSTAAPGYLDERAEAFDAQIAGALSRGDSTSLSADAGLGAELLAAGTHAWNAVARVTAHARWNAELLYDAAPYGVGYFVAVWLADA
jgi:hypothetical protein